MTVGGSSTLLLPLLLFSCGEQPVWGWSSPGAVRTALPTISSKLVSVTSLSSNANGEDTALTPNIPATEFSTSETADEADMKEMISRWVAVTGKSTSTVVAAVCLLSFCYWRDSTQLVFFVGSILNGASAKILKSLLKQQRPLHLSPSDMAMEPTHRLVPKDNGMPSSHATSLAFLCTFAALNLPWATLPLAAYVAISLIYRVQTRLHSSEQVLAGLFLGVTNCFLWRSLMYGTNLFHIDLLSIVDSQLPTDGLVPLPYVAVPIFIFCFIALDWERRIGRFVDSLKEKS